MVSGTHGSYGFLANCDRYDEHNSHSSCSSQDFWRDLIMLKYDCSKGVVMSGSFDRAWSAVRKMPNMSYVAAENTLSDMRQLTDILEERAYDDDLLLEMSNSEVSALRNIPSVASYLAELAQECLEAYQSASAYDLDKALPNQQAVRRRGGDKFMFADLPEGTGPYMGHGFESEGTIHPAILGMMARREKARHDESGERNRSEPNEQLRRILTKPKSVEDILEDGDMDMNIDANRELQNRRDFGRFSRDNKPTPIEEQEPGKLMGRNEYPESFDMGWQDKVHPGSGEFDRHEMRDGQKPHWMSNPRRGEER